MSTNSLLTHCKQRAVRYLVMSTNSLLTPCKQGAVLSRYSMALAMSTNSLLTRCKQRAVRYSPRSTYSPFLSAQNKLRTHTLLACISTVYKIAIQKNKNNIFCVSFIQTENNVLMLFCLPVIEALKKISLPICK